MSYFGTSGSFDVLLALVAGTGSPVPMTKWLSSPRCTSSLFPMTLTFFPKMPVTNESSCPTKDTHSTFRMRDTQFFSEKRKEKKFYQISKYFIPTWTQKTSVILNIWKIHSDIK